MRVLRVRRMQAMTINMSALSKTNEKSLIFEKNMYDFHKKIIKNEQNFDLHIGVSIFCDPKMIKKQSKIMNFHSKNTIICIRSPCIFVGKVILFFRFWNVCFSIIRISFAQNRRQK